MTAIQLRTGTAFSFDKVFSLYLDAEWSAYTSDRAQLEQAINNSLFVLTAWNGEELLGLLRAVGDGKSIIYVQDILVFKQFQRKGIGKLLLDRLVETYSEVRQIVLLTDRTAKTSCFYESCGFVATEDLQLQSFIRFRPKKDAS